MDTDKQNPYWTRPDDWPYEEDWDSPVWRQRMAEIDKRTIEIREKYGFIKCPKCGVEHTAKTIYCRECEYKVPTRPRSVNG